MKNTLNAKRKNRLNLGCGVDVKKGYINCDIIKYPGVERIVDITKKLPWKDNEVDEIFCSHVLEHLVKSPLDILLEFLRILKPEGFIEIRVPFCHHPSAFSMDHIRYFTIWSFFGIQNTKEFKFVMNESKLNCTYATSSKTLNTFLKSRLFGKDVGRGIFQYLYLPFFSPFFPFKELRFRIRYLKDENKD